MMYTEQMQFEIDKIDFQVETFKAQASIIGSFDERKCHLKGWPDYLDQQESLITENIARLCITANTLIEKLQAEDSVVAVRQGMDLTTILNGLPGSPIESPGYWGKFVYFRNRNAELTLELDS